MRTGVDPIPIIDVLDPDRYAAGHAESNGMPWEQYEYLRDAAPVFRYELGDPALVDHAWVVSRYDDVAAILRDDVQFLSSQGSGLRLIDPTCAAHGGKPSMVSMDVPEHRHNRSVIARAFTPAVVSSFEQAFRTLAVDVVDRAVAQGTVDFVDDIATALPLFAICDLLGVPDSDRVQMLEWTNALTVPSDPDLSPSPEALVAAVTGIWRYGAELGALRRRAPQDDLMSTIAVAVEHGELSDDELMGFMLSLTAAGNETTRNTSAHGLLALLQRPEQMAWLRAHANPVPATAVEEMLRWSSPVIHSRRTTRSPVTLHGNDIDAGEAVVVLYPSANFDPTAFIEPSEFDLTRAPNRHLTFAVGRHICLGAHIARLELRILFEELLNRASRIELIGPVGYVRDARMRGIKQMPVKLHRA